MKLLPNLSIQPLISREGKEAILMQKIICLMGKGVEQYMFELCHAMGHGVEGLETSRYSWMPRPGKIKIFSSLLQESWNKIPRQMVAIQTALDSFSSTPFCSQPFLACSIVDPSHSLFASVSLSSTVASSSFEVVSQMKVGILHPLISKRVQLMFHAGQSKVCATSSFRA
jgi:hypothetical protein